MEHLVCGEYSLLLLTVLGFDMAANAWRLFMYVDLIVVYHNPFRPNTARPLYHLLVAALVFSWLLAISSSDVLCSSDDGPPDGGQGPERSVNVPTLTWGLVYGPFLLFVLLGGSLYLAVKALLARDSDTKKSISRLARQRVMQHCFFYLMMYGILLGTLAAGYASYQFLSTPFPHPQRTFFAHVTAALTSGRPVFGFVGWTVINDVGPLACVRSTSYDSASEGGLPGWQQSRLAEEQGVREAGFKEELRIELVTDVATAISELAEAEARDFTGSPNFGLGPQTFGISAESFAAAFRRHESSDSARLLRESVSEGATGSFFYWVKNQDGTDTGYIVKQITKTEKDTLMSILPAYKAHVQSRGGASLLHYLSCHSMQLRWQWSGKVYFVVMRNFFPVRPQLSFDLKGATANRRALNTWELHQTNTVAGKYSTLRDWEWMDIGMTTDLEDRDKARIWAMICADCEFLHRQHILDYSLLLGIYRPPASLVPQAKQQRLQELASQCRGTGVVSRDRQKVYFFGIIDVLEKFTIRWRIQRAVLRLLYWLACRWAQSDGISAMPPPLYADRFRTFMAHEVLHMEEAHPTSSVLDDRFRAGQCCAAVYAWLRRLFGLPEAGRSQRKGGKARWQPLWERRRRGLVKERIVSEQEDQAARIKELEEHLSWLEYELATARGVHAAALQPLPERPDTLEFSAGRSTTVDSHAHGWSLLPRTAR